MIDKSVRDGPWPTKIETVQFSHRAKVNKNKPVGRDRQDARRQELEDPAVNHTGARAQVGMDARTERRRVWSGVGGLHTDRQTLFRQRVRDQQPEPVRIADLSRHRQPSATVWGFPADHLKVLPTGEAMQGMSSLRLGQRQLVRGTSELIPPVHDTVRPASQDRAAIDRPNLVCIEGNHQWSALPRQLAQLSPDAGDRRPVVACAQPELSAAQRIHVDDDARPSTCGRCRRAAKDEFSGEFYMMGVKLLARG